MKDLHIPLQKLEYDTIKIKNRDKLLNRVKSISTLIKSNPDIKDIAISTNDVSLGSSKNGTFCQSLDYTIDSVIVTSYGLFIKGFDYNFESVNVYISINLLEK